MEDISSVPAAVMRLGLGPALVYHFRDDQKGRAQLRSSILVLRGSERLVSDTVPNGVEEAFRGISGRDDDLHCRYFNHGALVVRGRIGAAIMGIPPKFAGLLAAAGVWRESSPLRVHHYGYPISEDHFAYMDGLPGVISDWEGGRRVIWFSSPRDVYREQYYSSSRAGSPWEHIAICEEEDPEGFLVEVARCIGIVPGYLVIGNPAHDTFGTIHVFDGDRGLDLEVRITWYVPKAQADLK